MFACSMDFTLFIYYRVDVRANQCLIFFQSFDQFQSAFMNLLVRDIQVLRKGLNQVKCHRAGFCFGCAFAFYRQQLRGSLEFLCHIVCFA